MADVSRNNGPMWVAVALGLVAALVLIAVLALARPQLSARAPSVPEITLRPPSLPDAPRLPDVPVPTPK